MRAIQMNDEQQRNFRRRFCALLVMVGLLTTACGGGSKNSPTAPTLQPYNQSVSGTVQAFGYVQHSIGIPRSGTMTLTLSWNTAADLDLYLATAACNTYPPGLCLLATSDNGTRTERISRAVTVGETFKAWVDSFSASAQNYTLSTSIQ